MNDKSSAGSSPLPPVAFLRSPAAQAALARLAAEPWDDVALPAQTAALRRSFSADEAAALLTQARLRRRAAAKFPFAERLLLAAEPLEQATAWTPALHRAARLAALAPPGPLLDLGCGLGGDLLALAHHRPVLAYEIDPARAALAVANVDAIAPPHPATVHVADWTVAAAAGRLPTASGAFADPARRTAAGKRLFSLHAMQPPLAALLDLQARVPLLAVKVAPGVESAEVPPGCCVEFVSHEGVCKEAVLWFGLPTGAPPRWAAVYHSAAWHEMAGQGAPAPLGDFAAGGWLFEADPAVVRAGALDALAAQVGGHLFDAEIAYLLADAPHATPFAAAFRVLERHPFSLKVLNARLAALGIGRVEIKKRGFPVEPETLRPRLRLTPGGPPAVVFLTRRGRNHWMILAERVAPTAPAA